MLCVCEGVFCVCVNVCAPLLAAVKKPFSLSAHVVSSRSLPTDVSDVQGRRILKDWGISPDVNYPSFTC